MSQRADPAALTGTDIKANVRRVAVGIRDRNLAPESTATASCRKTSSNNFVRPACSA
jgi:hypothetical protein